jgi:hypothetical protein
MKRTFTPGAAAAALALALLAPGGAAQAGFAEAWDTDPPGANAWYYFDSGAPNDGDVALTWVASGGNPGGYVQSPLGSATTWNKITLANSYFIAYAYGDRSAGTTHPIDLTSDPYLRVSFGNDGGVDLAGGGLYFWVGEWVDTDKFAFYYLNQALDGATASVWTDNVVEASSDPADWQTIADKNGPALADILPAPQQWGFGVFGGTARPQGTLAIDTLSLSADPPAQTPVPGSLVLALAGLAALARVRRG